MEPISLALAIAKTCGVDRMVGKWFSGKSGTDVAVKVIDAAQALVGGSRTPQELVELLSADKELSNKLVLQLNELAAGEDARVLADIADARAMQIAALQQDDLFSKRFVYFFAAGWSFASMGYIGFVTFSVVPTPNIPFANTCLGFVLGTLVATMINFFFGSSRSSQRKDATLDSMAATITPQKPL